jgi:hypothetical protein
MKAAGLQNDSTLPIHWKIQSNFNIDKKWIIPIPLSVVV